MAHLKQNAINSKHPNFVYFHFFHLFFRARVSADAFLVGSKRAAGVGLHTYFAGQSRDYLGDMAFEEGNCSGYVVGS